MADIELGQSIIGALVGSDPKLNGSTYDEYNISGLDAFRKVRISLDRPATAGETTVQVIHSTTGEILNGAVSSTGKVYGIGNSVDGKDSLYQINPSADIKNRIKLVDDLKDAQGVLLKNTFNALEFSADNQLYAIGSGSNKLDQIDPNTSVATSVADLPTGFTSSGDLAFDAANNRLLATSKDTTTTDALWQISLANPSSATKIGQIGFAGVQGINFENGQLTGFTNTGLGIKSITNRIKINPTSGVGTFDRVITGNGILAGVSGSATIPISSLGLDIKPDPLKIGSRSQGLPQHNTIDLRDFTGTALKADITTKGDAAYTNNIGFYVVEDVLLGTIKLANGSFLNPGDANYAVEAAKSAVLPAGKIDSKLNQDITGGKIYAPIVIAQGSLADFVNLNPTNGGGAREIHAYFNYVSGNADRVDHFKLLGNNIFAVEDQFGGGDRDFNDLVVNVNVKTV